VKEVTTNDPRYKITPLRCKSFPQKIYPKNPTECITCSSAQAIKLITVQGLKWQQNNICRRPLEIIIIIIIIGGRRRTETKRWLCLEQQPESWSEGQAHDHLLQWPHLLRSALQQITCQIKTSKRNIYRLETWKAPLAMQLRKRGNQHSHIQT
jgi:hypothetical protein